MIRVLTILLLALVAPYGLLCFVELDADPRNWAILARATLALIYGFYLWLAVQLTIPEKDSR